MQLNTMGKLILKVKRHWRYKWIAYEVWLSGKAICFILLEIFLRKLQTVENVILSVQMEFAWHFSSFEHVQ